MSNVLVKISQGFYEVRDSGGWVGDVFTSDMVTWRHNLSPYTYPSRRDAINTLLRASRNAS